jgi:UDP-glucose 4-epimerase
MNRYLVTGGAGFIGSKLALSLLQQGKDVTILDNLSSGKIENVPSACHFVKGCISDNELIEKVVCEADGVFHLAAVVSVQMCNDDIHGAHDTNVNGTLKVFKAASEANVPVVYASSAAVYGDPGGSICREVLRSVPKSPYGAGKLSCENYAHAMAYTHQLNSIGLRFFNVYGPGQDPHSPYSGVISRFTECVQARRPFLIYGDGHQSRDFVFVDDIIRALCRAMELIVGRASLPRAEVLNVCTGEATSLLNLVSLIQRLTNSSELGVEFNAERSGDIRFSCGDCEAMSTILRLTEMTCLEDGLSKMLNQLLKKDFEQPFSSS